MSSLNGVENSTGDVEDAIDYLNDRIPLDESCLLTVSVRHSTILVYNVNGWCFCSAP